MKEEEIIESTAPSINF